MEAKNSDRRRRWFGALFLILACLQVIWGQTWLKGFLEGHPLYFVLFWLVCFLLTTLAMVVALLDLWVMKIRARHHQVELNRSLLKGKPGEALDNLETPCESDKQKAEKRDDS